MAIPGQKTPMLTVLWAVLVCLPAAAFDDHVFVVTARYGFEALDPGDGALSVTYQPGCSAAEHNIVFGALEEVGSYAYSGQVCGIGNSGRHDGFDPGSASFFFLVVATEGESTEGSYGTATGPQERPEDLVDPVCVYQQQLDRRCD